MELTTNNNNILNSENQSLTNRNKELEIEIGNKKMSLKQEIKNWKQLKRIMKY